MKKIINPWEGREGYMCFGCAPHNPQGLQMDFYEDGDDVVGIWEPQKWYQGWINTLHGGIVATLMDEVGGWVVARKLQTTGVTSKMEVRYLKPISTEEPKLVIRARIKEQKRNLVYITSEIYNSNNEVCSQSEMLYFVASPEKARTEMNFCGCRTEDE
ncbi:uncharacterized protein (TIGR00369 family) [Parabacteroides sp. PFB2-12]|uniref:PaaI family thioesterase n=1 Tax=unclassified Parabacteroides TaxID=2649774 RepID=UPI002475F511|nr:MULTISPECIES: PaaI family thioesterase [unclassified Parabacteroides]MDH6344245.1 uncharacterized protein (TIGR00369 family) [Parabacteroides sp. PM6-13]MDH6392060.1 uncharacterized protein (TIGR00369 family) [Parabacteroides sp. PFB2-12]